MPDDLTDSLQIPDPIERHRGARAIVYEGDCRLGFESLLPRPPAAIVTDAPYGWWRGISIALEEGQINVERDHEWMGQVWRWMCEWLPPMRAILGQSKGVGWFFADQHYVGFYLRWARWTDWRLRAITSVSDFEMLMAFSDVPVPWAEEAAITCAKRNRQGPDKPVESLRPLISCAPEGWIYDPFCGGGSTLEAALREGRETMGWDLEPIAQQAAARCARVEQELAGG